jgi:hypothetical protein
VPLLSVLVLTRGLGAGVARPYQRSSAQLRESRRSNAAVMVVRMTTGRIGTNRFLGLGSMLLGPAAAGTVCG